jgi:hypothetical protein
MKTIDKLFAKAKIKEDRDRMRLTVSFLTYDKVKGVFILACQLWNGNTGIARKSDAIVTEHQTEDEARTEYEKLFVKYGHKKSVLLFDDLDQ